MLDTPPKKPRLLILREIIGDKKANPQIEPRVPVSRATWYAGVKDGRFPKPVKLPGCKNNYWRETDINGLIQGARG